VATWKGFKKETLSDLVGFANLTWLVIEEVNYDEGGDSQQRVGDAGVLLQV
jgi:hypothetical protein